MRIGSLEWMPPMGDYRSGPVRPRWNGPGWGTVVVAGLVVATMGWAVLAEEADAPAAGGAISGGREQAPAVPAGGSTPEDSARTPVEEGAQEQVPVAWERKTGTRPAAVTVRAAEPAVERTRTRPQEPAKRERRAEKPERREKPAKRADRGRPAERAGAPVPAGPVEARRTVAARGVAEPAGNPFSRLAGDECERQLPGAGPLCSMLLDQVFAGGQAHGGR